MSPSLPAFALPFFLFLAFWALCYTPLAGLARALTTGLKSGAAWVARGRMGKWVSRHAGPVGPYAPMLLVLAVGGAAAVLAGYVFGELVEEIRVDTSAVYRANQAIHTWVGLERQPAMTVLLRTVTTMGGTISLVAIAAAMAAVLLVRKERASAIFVVVTAGVGALLNFGLKMIFARARPDLASALAVARGYSFPSGHAMDSFIVFGVLACIALRQRWPWKARSAVLALALTMVVLVGLSRVYLGVHWASDIAGAWAAGTVWLTSAVTAFEMLLRLRQRHSGGAPTGPAAVVPDKPVPAKSAMTAGVAVSKPTTSSIPASSGSATTRWRAGPSFRGTRAAPMRGSSASHTSGYCFISRGASALCRLHAVGPPRRREVRLGALLIRAVRPPGWFLSERSLTLLDPWRLRRR